MYDILYTIYFITENVMVLVTIIQEKNIFISKRTLKIISVEKYVATL